MMARRNESLLNELAAMPWWVSLTLGAVVYAMLRYVVPLISVNNSAPQGLLGAAPKLAPLVAILFIAAAAVSAVKQFLKGRLLESQPALIPSEISPGGSSRG